MNGYEFEQVVAQIYRDNEYTNVSVTKGSGDNGVDVIAYKDGIKYGIQCKRYTGKVNNKAVQEVSAGSKYWGCHRAVVVTNSEFTEPAKDLALSIGVQLIDGEMLKRIDSRKRLAPPKPVYIPPVVEEQPIEKEVTFEPTRVEHKETIRLAGCLSLIIKIMFLPLYLFYLWGKTYATTNNLSMKFLLLVVTLLWFIFTLLYAILEYENWLFIVTISVYLWGYFRGRKIRKTRNA